MPRVFNEPPGENLVTLRRREFIADLTAGLEDLAASLRENGRSVAIKEPKQYDVLPTGYYIPIEEVLIYIGSGVTAALLNATLTDIYNSTKIWALARFKKKHEANPDWVVKYRFTIYGPGGKRWLLWEMDSEGGRSIVISQFPRSVEPDLPPPDW